MLYGQKCRTSTAVIEILRLSGVLNLLRIWHIESVNQKHCGINPKAVIIDWKTRIYTEPKYSVAATDQMGIKL